MQQNDIKLKLFSRKGYKNIEIDQFTFLEMNTEVEKTLKESITNYEKSLEEFELKKYDHIVYEKGRKTLETFSVNTLYESSELFKIILDLLINNSLDENYLKSKNIKYNIKTRLNEMKKLSFYVLEVNDSYKTNYYFKAFSLNSLYLKKNAIFNVRDATKLKEVTENYLNLDTNFDFYFSVNDKSIGDSKLRFSTDCKLYIKNATNFETIFNFREIYDNHRDKVIDAFNRKEIVTNISDYENEFNLAKYRRKYIQIDYGESIKNALKGFDNNIKNKVENQTTAIKVIEENNEITFEIMSKEGVEVFLDLMAGNVLMSFDESLQQVLSKFPIK